MPESEWQDYLRSPERQERLLHWNMADQRVPPHELHGARRPSGGLVARGARWVLDLLELGWWVFVLGFIALTLTWFAWSIATGR